MQFETEGESVQIQGLEIVGHIAELLDTDTESVNKTLLHRTVATGGGEVIEKGHTEQEASFGRNAFTKVTLRNHVRINPGHVCVMNYNLSYNSQL